MCIDVLRVGLDRGWSEGKRKRESKRLLCRVNSQKEKNSPLYILSSFLVPWIFSYR